ncbi:unnamed protein product [Cuscuta campestris]|uniref:Uncharacterized protein n=1 Tax=Cuscuta campestris TaxID=132261 RepID=A0A484M8S8_9ASTE|nr:unnamed protein product [Cuscuta campestris]
MGIYIDSKDVMISLLRDMFQGANDFGNEVIFGLRVCAFPLSQNHYAKLCFITYICRKFATYIYRSISNGRYID